MLGELYAVEVSRVRRNALWRMLDVSDGESNVVEMEYRMLEPRRERSNERACLALCYLEMRSTCDYIYEQDYAIRQGGRMIIRKYQELTRRGGCALAFRIRLLRGWTS